MLKKILILSAISSSAFMSPIAMAEKVDSFFYFTTSIGRGVETDIDGSISGTSFSTTSRSTFGGGIGLGYHFDNNLRIESYVSSAKAEVDSVTVSGTEYSVDKNGTGVGVALAIAYDFEIDSKITPYIEGSYGISWSDNAHNPSTAYGIALGISTPVAHYTELWGDIGLVITPEQTIKSVSYDEANSWGFSTGLRIRI